jgi:hypothetical protein
MTIEVTNHPYEGKNPCEAFLETLLSDAKNPTPSLPWTRIPADENSDKEGFRLVDEKGCLTILQIDSQDENHMQLSLRCLSSDGASMLTSTEWSTIESADNELRTLYALLDKQIPAASSSIERRECNPKCFLPMMEQLVGCLTVDAATLKTVSWTAKPSDSGLPAYCAEGRAGKDARFLIFPDSIDEDYTTFSFVYEVAGEEIFSITQKAPTQAHSELRNLYHAISEEDIPAELTRIESFVATERARQYLCRVLKDDFDQKPALVIGDIFRECNADAVAHQYVEALIKRQPNLSSNPDALKHYRIVAVSAIELLRRAKRQPNGSQFTSRVVDVAKKGNVPTNIKFSTSSLARISNCTCSYLAEFYSGVPRKCAINKTAVMILSAILRDY